MGRRRKTPAGAAEEDKDIVTLQRNQKSKEIPTEENSTDGMEEGETSTRVSQRTTRGRSKRESSNGDVDQEATVSTRNLRSTRSRSVELDKGSGVEVSRSRTRRGSNTQNAQEEDTEMKPEKRQMRKVGTQDDNSDREEPIQRRSQRSRRRSADSEESEEDSQVDRKILKGRKLESIEESNEGLHESPKKLKGSEKQSKNDSKSADAGKETLNKSPSRDTEGSGRKEKNEESVHDKEPPLQKHKQQIDVGKLNTKSSDDDNTSAGKKTEVEFKKDRKELSAPLKLQRNEVKLSSPDVDRQSPSRSS